LSGTGKNPGRDTKNIQEALAISVVEFTNLFHAGGRLGIEAMGNIGGGGKEGVTFVEVKVNGAGSKLGKIAYGSFSSFAGGVVPVALIDLFGEESLECIKEATGAAIEDELKEVFVGFAEEGHTGGFVDAPALDTDKAVFDKMEANSYAMASANFVKDIEDFEEVEGLAIDGNREAFFKSDGDTLTLIGGLGGQDAKFGLDRMGSDFEAFELSSFVGEA
jgi:hypothetical protein